MDNITLSLAITLICIISGACWKILSRIHYVETQLTNHLKHDIIRVENKIDEVKEMVYEVKQSVAIRCNHDCKKEQ